MTRCYSLEKGLGSGRIRISLLFRPVEAKLPPNLLGFDTGTLEINDISAQSTQIDLSKCEIRFKITTMDAANKVSRKTSEQRGDTVVWTPNDSSRLPVRTRYAAALLISFRDASGFKSSGRRALAVLWLRDLLDRTRARVECALWHARSGDYSRLKLNYVPPDGDLAAWDSDRERIERVGTVALDCAFWPGLAAEHYAVLGGHRARRRSSWDEYGRQRDAGFRDVVGAREVKAPEDHQARESATTVRQDHEQPEIDRGDAQPDAREQTVQDDAAAEGPGESYGTNTTVSADSAETVESPEGSYASPAENEAGSEGSEDGNESDRSEKKRKGLVGKVKEWREHERELHRDHRGIMQVKPVRTAEWLLDNIEDGAHAVKDRFKMKSRQPDVETEV